jgi:large subunit ribosomal protein L37Ae
MPSEKKVARGYGARYGPKIRGKYAKITKQARARYKCPYCKYEKAKRKAVGIWHCAKCDATFTNKAYKVGKLEPIKKVIESEFEEGQE